MVQIKSLFLVLLMSPAVLTELVRTQQTVVASLGDEALLKCELTTPKDVLQVTWQRVTEGRTENMATYSKRYGMKITDPFRDHVHFREAELQECSIAIEGVKKEDESCYKCLFNAFPDGAISGTTCLKVYELHEPMLEVRQTVVQDDGLQVHALSCSVTGRPAPNVSWDARNAILQNSTTTETVHHNGTTTITNHATAVVQSSLPDIEIKVKCVAEDPFKVEKKEIYRRIPIIRHSDSRNSDSNWSMTVVLAIIPLIATAGFGIWLHRKRRHQSRESSSQGSAIKYPSDSSSETNSTPASSSFKIQISPQTTLKKRESMLASPTNNGQFGEKKCKRSLF
ncbi:OX-2 membrane glycoprotein-like isoform X2 [Scleropages formosus]|uniref:OX-2 membrane glycoprotein-like isoform X2 n=1 Tax=Scleropages formosus TaxID=113540 RepID=UPI0010FACC3F|nr:OX-2 membrane glycoprotein-like isoform X2 [Scleropages formosus]